MTALKVKRRDNDRRKRATQSCILVITLIVGLKVQHLTHDDAVNITAKCDGIVACW